MYVNPVSFGKIVKVMAPFETAKQIEAIANGKPSRFAKLNSDVAVLFDDVYQGEAKAFQFDRKTSYIFSGKEGIKYCISRYEAIEEMNKVKEKFKNPKTVKNEKERIWNNNRQNAFGLIKKYGIKKTITPLMVKNKVRMLDYNI